MGTIAEVRAYRRIMLAAALAAAAACSLDARKFGDSLPAAMMPEAGTPAGSPGGVPVALDGARASPLAPSVSAGTNAIDFGRVTIGQVAPGVLVVRNSDGAPLEQLTASVTGAASDEFSIALEPSCIDLASSSTCSVTVTFAPRVEGLREAVLLLSAGLMAPSNGAASVEVVLTGQGVAATALVVAGTGDFGGQEVGVATAPQTFRITNTSTTATQPLRLSQPTRADFSVVANSCTGSLGAGASCAVSIVYQPTSGTIHNDSLLLEDSSEQVFLSLVGRGQYRLTVSRAGAGIGRVTGPVGLDCGSTCSILVDPGTVALSAITTNGSDSVFTGWAGAVDCVGPMRNCSIALVASRQVTATFAAQTNNLIFIASQNYTPDLGSERAFDLECNRLASVAGINDASGNGYVAAVSGAASFWDRIPVAARGWVRMDGLPIGDQQASLRAARPNVFYSVQFDEEGGREEFSMVWTGTTNEGEPADNCNGWTTTDPTLRGLQGSGRHGPFWLDSLYGECDSNRYGLRISMYCMGVTKSAPINVPTFAGAKRMWVTNTDYMPGATTPDAQCNAERPPGVGASRAFIGYTGRVPDAALELSATYVRPDGHLVGTGEQIAAGNLASGLWLTADGTFAFSLVWTGRGGRGGSVEKPTDTDTCLDWSSTAGQGTLAVTGDDGMRGLGYTFANPCTEMNARLYCLEL